MAKETNDKCCIELHPIGEFCSFKRLWSVSLLFCFYYCFIFIWRTIPGYSYVEKNLWSENNLSQSRKQESVSSEFVRSSASPPPVVALHKASQTVWFGRHVLTVSSLLTSYWMNSEKGTFSKKFMVLLRVVDLNTPAKDLVGSALNHADETMVQGAWIALTAQLWSFASAQCVDV